MTCAHTIHRRYLVQALMAVGCWLHGGMAQAIDLQQAYAAAVQNDAATRAARSGAEATRERLPQARSQLLPNISATAARTYNDVLTKTRVPYSTRPVVTDAFYYSGSRALTVRQPLYRPANWAALRQAEAYVMDANAVLEEEEQALVVRVGEAYFDALLADEQLALVLAQKTANTTQLDSARKTYAAGSGTVTDVSEAQARVDLSVAQELEARQNLELTRQRLKVLTGVPIDTLARLDTNRFVPHAPQPTSLDAWVELAESNSPELQSHRARLEVAKQEVEKAKAGHKPTLDAVAQWSYSSSDNVTASSSKYDSKTIGLQLSVPLYAGGYVNSTVRQALAGYEQARELMEAARRELGVRVYREYRGVTEGVPRILALEQAVKSAEQSALSNQRSYAAGVRTTVDVLNAEQQKTMALRDLAQARYGYLVSRMRLQSLAGGNRQSGISEINAWLMQ